MAANKSQWAWWLRKVSRKIWFRAVAFALMGVVAALLAAPIAAFIPSEIASRLDPDALAEILRILASSMLIVATFSLSTAISAFAAASSATTPRATELLMQDSSAQNAISTFVGGFLFALVGFIGMGAGIYGESGHVALFVLTLVMIVVIVATFLRWVGLLSNFGRVGDAIDRTADAAAKALRNRVKHPHLGGRPSEGQTAEAGEVVSGKAGYVAFIDMRSLQAVAEAQDGNLIVSAMPGDFVTSGHLLVRTTFAPKEACIEAVCEAFDISDNRSFDQDPAHGLSALAEIGIKALSPSLNDPVTAIRVIDRIVGVLGAWANASGEDAPKYDRVFVPPLDVERLFDIAFSQLALYSAKDLRVGLTLQRALRSMSRVDNDAFSDAAVAQAVRALALAETALALEADFDRVKSIHESFVKSRADD